MGLKPNEVWELTLAEYNMYIDGYGIRAKDDTAHSILTGYYAAYYINGGKKAKSPNDLIKSLYSKQQSRDDGIKEIERIKRLEKEGKYG